MEEAAEISNETPSRFPLEPQLWLDRALVCQGRSDPEGESAALRKGLECRPWWGEAVRRLADFHERSKNPSAARKLLEKALEANPLDPLNHGWLADVLWKSGEKKAAMARIERALFLDPSYTWAWRALSARAEELIARPASRIARELTVQRPGDAAVTAAAGAHARVTRRAHGTPAAAAAAG